jgi:hypothetical protein
MKRLLLGLALAIIAHEAEARGQWYYCDPAHAYYPYVSRCSTPWRAVVPYNIGRVQNWSGHPQIYPDSEEICRGG